MMLLKLSGPDGVIHDIVLNVEGSPYGCIYENPFLLKFVTLVKAKWRDCTECEGKGKLIFGSGEASARICPTCQGQGKVVEEIKE
jgi:hypothetical protein